MFPVEESYKFHIRDVISLLSGMTGISKSNCPPLRIRDGASFEEELPQSAKRTGLHTRIPLLLEYMFEIPIIDRDPQSDRLVYNEEAVLALLPQARTFLAEHYPNLAERAAPFSKTAPRGPEDGTPPLTDGFIDNYLKAAIRTHGEYIEVPKYPRDDITADMHNAMRAARQASRQNKASLN
jgi:hypothetical protein